MTYIDDNNLQNMQRADIANTTKMIYSSPTVTCECGNKVFVEGFVLKKVSSLLTGTGKEELVPIPVYVCSKCGAIPKEFLDRPAAKTILGEEDIKQEESSILIK